MKKTLVLAALALAGSLAQAQSFPNKPILWVVPYTGGGITDNVTRMVTQKMQASLGQTIVVENKPGANSIIGADLVAKAPPDGYSIVTVIAAHAANATLYQGKLPFDAVKSFVPFSLPAIAPLIMTVNNNFPAKDAKELIAYAKANPNKLNYASSGNGSLQHVSTELLNQMAGIQITHVPYKGTGPAMTDLLGGNVDMTITTPPPLMGHIAAGKLRPLVVTSKSRLESLKDVPSAPEAGYPDLDVSSWFAMYAPAGTPKPVIDKLTTEIEKIMKTDAFRKKAEELGAEAKYMNPQQLDQYQKAELQRWGKVIKSANIHAE